MRALRDPEGIEIKHIKKACRVDGKNILEIGCGHGQLTFQYSGSTSKTFAIDPNLSELDDANHDNPFSNTFFVQSKAEQLPFPSKTFRLVIFASSL